MIRMLAVVAAATLAAGAANATTVTNMDKSTASITYMPKHGKAMHFALKPHHYRTIACKDGGRLMFGKSTASCSAKTAKITVTGGKLVI